MTREEFGALFQSALERAALNAESKVSHAVPRNFRIRLHGAGYGGQHLMGVQEGADMLYLGEHRFYRIVDLAVTEIVGPETIVFVRASDHEPGTLAQTWDTPPGSGPFKQLLAEEISVRES
jgi:hypothetical protein